MFLSFFLCLCAPTSFQASEFIGGAPERLSDALLRKPFKAAAGARSSSYTIPLTRDEAMAARDAIAAATYARLFDWLVRASSGARVSLLSDSLDRRRFDEWRKRSRRKPTPTQRRAAALSTTR